MMTGRALLKELVFLAALLLAGTVEAQTISGHAFEDLDADGVCDPGEPPIEGVLVELFGHQSGGGNVNELQSSAGDGGFAFSPGTGVFLLLPHDPADWRMSQAREDLFPENTPGYLAPVGRPRFGKLDQGIENLKSGGFLYSALGDSIGQNFNICLYISDHWYSDQVRGRIQMAAPQASVQLYPGSYKYRHVDYLLEDVGDNVFRMIAQQPQLITISMMGNDMLDVEPGIPATQEEINIAVAEVLDVRQNFQEVLSSLLSEIPGTDISLNTLYDNYSCNSSDHHRAWIPIFNRILRDLAWGQARRVSINEVAAEFGQENQLGQCRGFTDMICHDFFGLDYLHPNNAGYEIVREKVWEAVGGVSLGADDALGRTSIDDVNYGFLRRVRRLSPTIWETRNGATVTDPEAAFDNEDGGSAAGIHLGIGQEEFRLAGFPDFYDEIRIVRVIAGVRYKTTGTVNDDFYRMEASVNGQFRPDPGHAYTPFNWNFYTPIVGGGGPNQPAENPDSPFAALLVVPNVGNYREVSATLTKNPVLPNGAAHYEWPAITHEELATATIRVAAAPVARSSGNDDYTVQLDSAWLDLYGWEASRPEEVKNLRAWRHSDGTLHVAFDPVADATRYNLYLGRLDSLRHGVYDHGRGAPMGPYCGMNTHDAGGGRLKFVVDPAAVPPDDAYFLVTAHTDDVESPAGYRFDGEEIDRSQSVCR